MNTLTGGKLIEQLDIIRIVSRDAVKRNRMEHIKTREIDDEFNKLIKTVRAGKPLPKSGYQYLKYKEYDKGTDLWRIIIATKNGSRVILDKGNWEEFCRWVKGGWYLGHYRPNTLDQYNKLKGEGYYVDGD